MSSSPLTKAMLGRTFVLLFGLAILLRLPSFWISVIDHDESTYTVIANELLRGGTTLYKDWADTKPPGIFLIFAGIIAISGKSIWLIRLVGAMVVAITATLLYIAKRRLNAPNALALAVSISYIVAMTVHKWSLPVNTELFFNVLTAAALCLMPQLLAQINTHTKATIAKSAFIFGSLLGIGFMIKYVVLFDFLALCLLWLCFQLTINKYNLLAFIGTTWHIILLCSIGFILPFSVVYTWFYAHSLSHYFYEAAFEITSRYPSSFDLGKSMAFLGQFLLSYLPLVFGCMMTWYYAYKNRFGKTMSANFALLGLPIWLFFALLSILLPGKGFAHYFIQPLLPLVFWSMDGFYAWLNEQKQTSPFFNLNKAKLGLTLLFLIIFAINIQRFCLKPDIRREIAAHISPQLRPNDIIYAPVATILYFLLDKSPPTRYVHSSLLTNADHIQALQIDVDLEFSKIIAQNPRFIILNTAVQNTVLQTYLQKHCYLQRSFEGDIALYERKYVTDFR